MASRRLIVGCAGIGALALAAVVIVSVLAYSRITATVPLPDVAGFVGEDARGFAVLALHADDPWIAALIERIDEKRRKRADLLPLEITWVSFRAPDGTDGHAVRLAVSRRGRLIASLLDLALWHAGHSGDMNVSRTERSGEGITSFPGSPLPGFLFVRDTSIVWAPTAASADGAVAALGVPAGPSARSLLDRAPAAPRAILRGALRNPEGSMAGLLRSIPGRALDLEDGLTRSVEGVSFRFETTSPDEGAGIVDIDFRPGTSPGEVRRFSGDLAGRIEGLGSGELILVTSVRIAGDRATIEVLASGLLSLHAPILSAPGKLREAFREHAIAQSDEGDA